MKQLIITALALGLSLNSSAQLNFGFNQEIPVQESNQLALPWVGGIDYAQFSSIDLNKDGRNDLFLFDRHNNKVSTFLNNGSTGADCWEYAPQYEASFPKLNGWAFLYDYNVDGKPDLFTIGSHNNGIAQYINDSPLNGLHFTLVDTTILSHLQGGTQLSNIIASSLLMPAFNDVDNDGDMDIVGQQFLCVGAFAYYRNMSMEDHGVPDVLDDYVMERDPWGKFALRAGLYTNVAVNYFNINCQLYAPPHAGNWYDQSAAAPMDDTYANIFTIDIDGDGDKDALIGDSQTHNSLLVVNGGTSTDALMTTQDTLFPSYDTPASLTNFVMHSYVDVDNDGKRDLVFSNCEQENKVSCSYYKNTGTDSAPVLNFQFNQFLQKDMIDVGEGASPLFYDWDHDGLKDLIIGNKDRKTGPLTTDFVTGLTYYRNVGTSTFPAFQLITDDLLNLQAEHYTGQLSPTFGDIDGDGDDDLLLGCDGGTLIYYRNDAGTYTFQTAAFMSIDVGNASNPQLIDLNRDSKLDLVIGCKGGTFRYFENVGTTTVPFFTTMPTVATLGGIDMRDTGVTDGFTSGYIFDQGGVYRMVAAAMNGQVLMYGNIDGNISGTFSILDTITNYEFGSRYGYNVSVSGGDIDGDTLTDLVFGLYSGGLKIYCQNFTSGITSADKQNTLAVYPNPASTYVVAKFTTKERKLPAQLFDARGQLVKTEMVIDGYAVFSTTDIAAGMYYITVKSASGNYVQKVLISK